MKKFFAFLTLAILLLAGILVFNAMRFPKAGSSKADPLLPLPDSAVTHLQTAIQFPTISWAVSKPIDTAAFQQFSRFIEAAYPLLHQRSEHTLISQFSHIFYLKGTDTTLDPIVLMGHYDVVPVEAVAEKMWRQKPFGGALVADTIWGRGTVDDKGAVIAILESVEQLLRSSFSLKRGMYLCFGHDEEIGGTRGAAKMAAWMKEKGVEAYYVLDEGGMIKVDKRVANQPLAVIGVQEKGYASYKFSVEIPGGHSSQPTPETAIDILTKALTKLRLEPAPAHIPDATREFLEAAASTSPSFLSRLALANQWIMGPLIQKQLTADKQTSAMIRTTIVPTILEAGVKDNVIPTVATAVVNTRIIPGETPQSVLQYLSNKIGDSRVKIAAYDENWWAPSGKTDTKGPAFSQVTSAIKKVMDDVVPAPYLVIGATDSRYFRPLTTEVMNFSASAFFEGYHGIDERLPVQEYRRMIGFVTHLIKDSQQ